MSITYQNGKDRNAEKKFQGCLGKMVNLFELNIGVPANKRITDKPHQDGFTSSRRISSDLSSTTICGDRVEEKETKSDRKSHITPVKMLMDQEMSKEARSKHGPPNLVAKLMGLDSLPQEDPNRIVQRVHTRSRSVIPVSDYEQDSGFFEYVDDEMSKQTDKSRHERGFIRTVNDEKMALVRQKFAEAKRLSMDEKHRNSKKLQDALDVLNSNKDLFLKCLQEPSPVQSVVPPPTEKKRITVLRPSKVAEGDDYNNNNKNGKQNKNDVVSSQPTRIVVLKPKSHIDDIVGEECIGDAEDYDDESHEVREVAKAITIQMREKLGRYHKDEAAMDSSLFSKGYVGDESSLNRSEFEYSEVMSPVSRHSWDCINRHGSPYSPSALSRASYSSESSVSREAKKRLSERWALMSTNDNPHEIRRFQRSSSTLGEMLSLSEVKKAAATKSEGKSVEEQNKDSNPALVNGHRVDDIADGSPRNLIRSKSLPVSSAPKEETKTSSSKSSFRVKVSNLLFARNRKTSKDKSLGSITTKDEIQPVSGQVSNDNSTGTLHEKLPAHASPNLQESTCAVVSLSDHIGKKDVTCSEDQPSPVSVLDTHFEEDDHHTPKVFPRCELPDKHGSFPLNPIGSKSIDKSPPIGSIARTLSWDDLCTDTSSLSSYPSKDPSAAIQESEADKQEWIVYVETLLSGLKGTSPDSPLDPSLRDKYIGPKDHETLTEAKRRQKRSIQKLMFDYVNAALIEDDRSSSLVDRVRSRINAWFRGEENASLSGNFGDDYVMVIEGIVKEEVTGRGWTDKSRQETGNLGKEIEGKLLEELVHETVLEMTG